MNMELQSKCEVGSMGTFVCGLRSNQKRAEELLTCSELSLLKQQRQQALPFPQPSETGLISVGMDC